MHDESYFQLPWKRPWENRHLHDIPEELAETEILSICDGIAKQHEEISKRREAHP